MLLKRLATAQHEVTLVAPYISNAILRECLTATPSSAKVNVLTALRLDSYLSGSLEVQELRNAIQSNSHMAYSLARLHAKAIVVDDTFCYIGSNNLTFGGWARNAELGVSFTNSSAVSGVSQTIRQWLGTESCFRIETSMLDELLKLPRQVRTTSATEIQDFHEPLKVEDIQVLEQHLGGWRGATLQLLRTKLPTEFALSELYAFEPHFRELFPNNENIQAKLRQQLQDLRDLGLVVFLGKGRYQKLF